MTIKIIGLIIGILVLGRDSITGPRKSTTPNPKRSTPWSAWWAWR